MKVEKNEFVIDDAVQIAPQHYRTRIENDRVRVLEFRSRPGEKSALHTHPDSVVYSFNPATMLVIGTDGAHETIELQTGEVIWQRETTHALENIGTTEAHLLIIELVVPREPIPLV